MGPQKTNECAPCVPVADLGGRGSACDMDCACIMLDIWALAGSLSSVITTQSQTLYVHFTPTAENPTQIMFIFSEDPIDARSTRRGWAWRF